MGKELYANIFSELLRSHYTPTDSYLTVSLPFVVLDPSKQPKCRWSENQSQRLQNILLKAERLPPCFRQSVIVHTRGAEFISVRCICCCPSTPCHSATEVMDEDGENAASPQWPFVGAQNRKHSCIWAIWGALLRGTTRLKNFSGFLKKIYRKMSVTSFFLMLKIGSNCREWLRKGEAYCTWYFHKQVRFSLWLFGQVF